MYTSLITPADGLSLSSLQNTKPPTFFPRNSFITNATLVDESRLDTIGTVRCYGGNPTEFDVAWYRGDSSELHHCPCRRFCYCRRYCASQCQSNGVIQYDVSTPGVAVIHVLTEASAHNSSNFLNQDLECQVTNGPAAFLGVYFRDVGGCEVH